MSLKNLLLSTALFALCSGHASTVLDVDGGILDDGIDGEFPDYLLADNTVNIPPAVQSDGTATITLSDDGVCQWNNAGYPFGQQYEINWHPGGLAIPSGSPDLATSIAWTMYMTVTVDSTTPIDISNLTLRFWRNDRDGPPRRYYILYDGDQNGFDTGDVIADSINFPDADEDGLIPFDHFGVAFTKEFSVDPGLTQVTQAEFRFYVSNTPNRAGNTHWIYAGITYDAGAGPVVLPATVDLGLSGADVQISVDSLSSQSYSLERSTDLTNPGAWGAVGDQVPAAPATGNDGTLLLTDPGGSSDPEAFYRINVTAP